jgi:hypothetical protein
MQNMARGISSIVTTAVVAGAIGFGAGVYLVPNEKADQFRAMVQGGLGAIYRIVHSDKANPDIPPSESSQTKAPEAQPDVPAGSQPGADANAILATRRVVVDSLSMPHRRDVAAPSSSSPGQDDQPSHALDTRSFWNCAAEQLTNHRK